MLNANDTIAAIVTAPGRAGVGIVRVSGPQARPLAERLFRSAKEGFSGLKPYRLHHGMLLDAGGRPLDDVLCAFMPGPNSYTGEDVVEFNCHGTPAVLRAVLGAALSLGARHAERGEFTKRAFLSGRMDLSQAQAVAELVAADTLAGAGLALARLEGVMARRVSELRSRLEGLRVQICLAVDFPEEEVDCLEPASFLEAVGQVTEQIGVLVAAHGRARPFREGALAVLAGPVNAGKSSLLNALIGRERAIVCDAPGTTRDFLEEQLDLGGLPVRLVDTAGLRATDDPVEREGVARCQRLVEEGRVVLLVLDGTRDFDLASLEGECGPVPLDPDRVLGVINKADRPPAADDPYVRLERAGIEVLRVSARTGHGLEELCAALRRRLLSGSDAPPDSEPVPNDRECALLRQAASELDELSAGVAAGLPPDLLGVRLESACAHLGGITGEITPDEVLGTIFDGFCIGK
ncbi:tRNA uridine-5-carboxymethylaminomethyl(34) synthesis GTPase MnmE [Fundidesulfovibrio terrae]|uniref:tRNA uridine-5-carboxymethylaminomethyl(34) synthesis GTPase MnmE n=1 Tax=Fundidesulfovibrio terrae TaxID=2922866 RepID=UPI001FB03EEE